MLPNVLPDGIVERLNLLRHDEIVEIVREFGHRLFS